MSTMRTPIINGNYEDTHHKPPSTVASHIDIDQEAYDRVYTSLRYWFRRTFIVEDTELMTSSVRIALDRQTLQTLLTKMVAKCTQRCHITDCSMKLARKVSDLVIPTGGVSL